MVSRNHLGISFQWRQGHFPPYASYHTISVPNCPYPNTVFSQMVRFRRLLFMRHFGIINWDYGIKGASRYGKDGAAGWLQPDVSRISCAANADERAGRHAHECGARLCDDAAEGDRRGATRRPGCGLRHARAHLPQGDLRRLQGHPQAHARRPARPGSHHP